MPVETRTATSNAKLAGRIPNKVIMRAKRRRRQGLHTVHGEEASVTVQASGPRQEARVHRCLRSRTLHAGVPPGRTAPRVPSSEVTRLVGLSRKPIRVESALPSTTGPNAQGGSPRRKGPRGKGTGRRFEPIHPPSVSGLAPQSGRLGAHRPGGRSGTGAFPVRDEAVPPL